MSVKKLDLTIEVLKQNLQAFPEHSEPLNLLANLYIQQGDHARAEEWARKALAIQPGNPRFNGSVGEDPHASSETRLNLT